MRIRGVIFVGCFFLALTAQAQSVDSLAPSAPTSFSSNVELGETADSTDFTQQSPGIYLQDYGARGKSQTFSVRGARASDVAVSLEGVRLNSPATGEFDFGNFSLFGFEEGKVIRGGYAPLSSSPSGQVLLKLPRDEKSKAAAAVGSYGSLSLGLKIPNAVFALDQTEGDYPYELNGEKKTRDHNFGQRLNMRTWKRGKDYQVWLQVLYSDQELPGPVSSPSLGESQTLSPTLAYQGRSQNYEWTLWASFQNQDFADHTYQIESTNRWWTSGLRDQGRFELSQKLQLETALEWTQDKMLTETENPSDNLKTPLRQTLSLTALAYYDLTDRWLLQPRIRGEFVSDLSKEHFSVHPGLGSRYRLNDSLDLLGNLAWISRPPNFQEMYYRLSGFVLENPSLKRQRSLQGDFGYEIHTKTLESLSLKFQQALFFDRTERLLQTLELPGGSTGKIYQAQNIGTSLAYGLENSGSFQWGRFFRLTGGYTFQSAEVSGEDRIYQPTHRLSVTPQIFPEEPVCVSVPFSFRTSVKTLGDGAIPPQYNLALALVGHLQKFEAELRIFNLLGWNRDEVKDFPLSSEPSVRFSLKTVF